MAKQVAISAVIITFNEERNIGRCLDSLQGVADDIVVVDSYSKDRTKEICEYYGVRFVQHSFAGHIEQKNWAITQAEYPHVLSLDADEALSEELKQEVLAIKNDWRHDGYIFNRFTNYCGKWIRHCGWYPDRKLRLFDSRKGAWGGVNPHDKYILEENTTKKIIDKNLLHYSYHSISDHILQIDKFTDIGSKHAYQNGRHVNLIAAIISSSWKFFRKYFLELGIMDGYYGYVISRISAHGTFIKYIKIIEMQKKHK